MEADETVYLFDLTQIRRRKPIRFARDLL